MQFFPNPLTHYVKADHIVGPSGHWGLLIPGLNDPIIGLLPMLMGIVSLRNGGVHKL